MEKCFAFLRENAPETPCLVVDLQQVRQNYIRLREAMPFAVCHYAVKANPAPSVVDVLVSQGSSFDAASINEIRLCLERGAKAEQILFGNTIKKRSHIEEAYAKGLRKFTFDSHHELEKLAAVAPGSKVICRIQVGEEGAAWPLSKKFGCTHEVAVELMKRAQSLGMEAYGLSFHAGSQQTRVETYQESIATAAKVFHRLRKEGVVLKALDIGGGFPVPYRTPVPDIEAFGKGIREELERSFCDIPLEEVLIEPGRFMTGEAGVLMAEVVLVDADKELHDRRWVYLDVGKFTGLTETEAIEYTLTTDKDGEPERGLVTLAGPTCDSIDIIYEKRTYLLPRSLTDGDKVYFHCAGAYTSSYSTVGFNGFAPLHEHYLPEL